MIPSRPRKIAVFTATRAEYGLLFPVLKAMRLREGLDVRLLVSGTHLSKNHGLTIEEIEHDGEPIAARIPILQAGDDALSVATTMARALEGCARAYETLQPDAVMLLGDRTELLGAAAAATAMRIPILHLEGGHVTEGAVDDAVRHAITKLASLHFTAAAPYRDRIIQMGEDPARVHAVGSTGLDNLLAEGVMSVSEFSDEIGVDLKPGFLLTTFHPETLADLPADAQVAALREALDRFPHLKILYTLPNADEGNAVIRTAIQDHAASHPSRVHAFESLGRRRYAWALSAASAVVGNSSSGVIEAPMHRTPTVNIGGRQDGRLRAASVIDTPATADSIANAIRHVLTPAFRVSIHEQQNPMGDGHAAERIASIVEATNFGALRRKRFFDRIDV